MYKLKTYQYLMFFGLSVLVISCKVPALTEANANKSIPAKYGNDSDSSTIAIMEWRSYFKDKNLIDLIDTALKNNQELLIALQEIEIARNDIRVRKGALLPIVGLRGGTGVEKVGRYTSQGAGDASTEITPGKEVPDLLTDITLGAYANWEVDIWKKLRNAKKAAITRYLSTVEGRNFVITNLIAEIANLYYELKALDNQLEIVRRNIKLQSAALEIVKAQKESSRATELAVQKFQAEVLGSQNREFDILQNITETENRINYLLGRYPQEIKRDNADFLSLLPSDLKAGIPSQLLANRADIKQAELDLVAAQIDVNVAHAEFYPSLSISAALGIQAFKPTYLYKLPESVLFSLAGDLAGPLINRNAIKAEFSNANARQLQEMFQYQRTVLNAFMEVSNQLSNISNLDKSFLMKSKQVAALDKSIDVANDLFKSARVDYFEVLMTQRDALEAQLELIETKKNQLKAAVQVYRDLGGGWR